MSTKNILANILNTKTPKKLGDQLGIYTNQWRFRSTRSLIHVGDFYYNSGSLDGDEILRQFLDVVSLYEMIGVRVFRIVSDGGGGN